MSPRFGEQTPKEIAKAKWDDHDPDFYTSFLWFKKTGKPPKEYEDYDPLSLIALLVEADKLLSPEDEDEDETNFKQEHMVGPPTLGKLKYGKAYKTGDPLVDKWEQEIAAGLDPDLNETLDDVPGV